MPVMIPFAIGTVMALVVVYWAPCLFAHSQINAPYHQTSNASIRTRTAARHAHTDTLTRRRTDTLTH
eukprot:142850-Lingulodinium_polyedra.AAC.1